MGRPSSKFALVDLSETSFVRREEKRFGEMLVIDITENTAYTLDAWEENPK